ncbi:TetR/AcrR family transcriptional regulator [Temperatibacter marinus]|uniref:TetR/AcrR family transcriptional regulator n=1 Tax=Temperatibacter marinus TaxID=1456591 RepID=A0AA52EI87_9PROT|nr:TetR/AcrR family transcriptional regulator [Temperatibacter marinus]WND02531.1 TetR/AcrR family transcriptional regulator [Temperatibacter marinus]
MTQSSKGNRRTRILDEAEKLFAKHGFDGVTMRQLATAAEVDVALASYHFKNKRGLFDAVLWRRSEIMNDLRHKALDKVLEDCGDNPPPIDALIESCIQPLFDPEFDLDEGWRHYYELIAYVNNSPEWGREIMTEHFAPLLDRYLKAFRDALPKASEEDIYHCYHFMSGAITLTMAQTGRMDAYSKGKLHSADFFAIYKSMVPFVTAGFKALCQNMK